MKKIMFLGAAVHQMSPIKYSYDKGYFIITCDNIKSNPGHKIANKSYNISTVKMEEILAIAKKEKIDGIMTYASDISANAVAYVSNNLGLPGNSIESVKALTNKGIFRKYINQGIEYKVFKSKKNAISYCNSRKTPFVIKPTDSSGSKGVSVVSNRENIGLKLSDAFLNSMSNEVIVEDFISKKNNLQICGDGFMLNNKLKFICFGDGYFYESNFSNVPWGETFPSCVDKQTLRKVKRIIEEILNKLDFGRGAFNFDVFIKDNGEPFINEIGPRNGGNFIPEIILLQSGVNLIRASVESALNQNFSFDETELIGPNCYASYMIHSKEAGFFKGVTYSKQIKEYIINENIFLNLNDKVNSFSKGSDAVGNLILKFETPIEMQEIYPYINEHIKVKLR